MKNRKNLFYTAMLAICALAFAACGDDETYDVYGDPYNRVYMKTGSYQYVIAHTPKNSISDLNFEASVYATRKSSSVVKATVEIDNSYVEAYNLSNGTNYETIPDNALELSNNQLAIAANERCSEEGVTLKIKDSEVSKFKSENGYLIPLRITSVNGENSAVSTDMNTIYLKVDVKIDTDLIFDDATTADIQGSLVTDHSGWNAYMTEENATVSGSISSMFDGNNYSNWGGNYTQPFDVVIDLGQEYDMTGIYSTYYGYSSAIEPGMIYISTDGQKWSELGTCTSSMQTIVLYSPVKTRYIKWGVPLKQSWGGMMAYFYISEFNIYAK